ncbi:MAG: FKBP-type peptidyl-prolyl cis-trans isomerase N-terminal domain-containing protein [Rikenellaceae bacterium]
MKKTILAVVVAVVALVAVSCGGSTEKAPLAVKGDPSKLDSVSYAVGANVAHSMSRQLVDIPIDFKALSDGFTEAVLETKEINQEENGEILRDYFMNKRQARGMAVQEARDAADSIAIAGGADPEAVAETRALLKADASMFESEEERKTISYAIGADIGLSFMSLEIPLQTYWVNKAIDEVVMGSSIMTAEQTVEVLNNYVYVVRPAQRVAEAAEMMEKISKQRGVVTTESGLMYRVVKAGDKLAATQDEDVVKVFYTGKVVRTDDMFDTNRFSDQPKEQQEAILAQNPDAAKDEPVEFALNGVIKGWTEGMKLVGKGGHILLWIPAELAYGQQGIPQAGIGPNEPLFFDVEIVDVIPAAAE